MTSITIAFDKATSTVDAELVAEYLAMHPTPEDVFKRWTVTHVPSGRAVGFGFADARAARRFARRMARLPIDWSSTEAARAWQQAHLRRFALAYHGVGGTLKRTAVARWQPVKRWLWRRLETPYTRLKDPIATWLDRSPRTCWADLVMWMLNYKDIRDCVPQLNTWAGSLVADCRRDARVQGACYCGKFVNRRHADEYGIAITPGERPYLVTSEMTADDEEVLISFKVQP